MLAMVMLVATFHAPLAQGTAQETDFSAILKTAGQGDAEAQFKLGTRYALGDGVARDYGADVVPKGCRAGLCRRTVEPRPHVCGGLGQRPR